MLKKSKALIVKFREGPILKIIYRIFRVFQSPRMIKTTTYMILVSQYFCRPSFTADKILVKRTDSSSVEQVDDPFIEHIFVSDDYKWYMTIVSLLYIDMWRFMIKSNHMSRTMLN